MAESFYTQVLCPVCSSDPQDVEVHEDPTWADVVCGICGSEYRVLIDQDKVKKFSLVG